VSAPAAPLRGAALHAALTRRGLTPFAYRLHRLALLITEHDLPCLPLAVHEQEGCVTVDGTGRPLAESEVRRWAAALSLVVTEAPVEQAGRVAAVLYKASGLVDGTHWTVQATVPVEARWPQ
jgi:hypothetical protein